MNVRPRFPLALLGLALLTGATDLWAQRANILPPNRREATVDLARSLADRPGPAPVAEELNNPFFPNSRKPKPAAPGEVAAPASPPQSGPANNYELLETIAPELNPTGTVILGGEPLLLFGQKKIRVGDVLPVIFEGNRYTLIISAIETSYFTIRLGDAELTRPIKTN